jgi:hypothetical protein
MNQTLNLLSLAPKQTQIECGCSATETSALLCMDIALQKEGSCDVALPFELIQSNGVIRAERGRDNGFSQ